jgi:hypothetical protein
MSEPRKRNDTHKRALALALICAAVALGLAPASTLGLAPDPTITTVALPAELPIGAATTISGQATEGGLAARSRTLSLQSSPYPYTSFTTVAHTTSTSDGSYSFVPLHPDRNTRLRVILEGSPTVDGPTIAITVDPLVAINSHSLGAGRDRLSARIKHSTPYPSAPMSAFWYLAPHGSDRFHLAAVTPTREIAAGITYASAIVDPPSKRFLYRLCLNPPWEAAMGPAAAHGTCPDHSFRLPAHAR